MEHWGAERSGFGRKQPFEIACCIKQRLEPRTLLSSVHAATQVRLITRVVFQLRRLLAATSRIVRVGE